MKYLFYIPFIVFVLFFIGIMIITGDLNTFDLFKLLGFYVLIVGIAIIFDRLVYQEIKKKVQVKKHYWILLLTIDILFIGTIFFTLMGFIYWNDTGKEDFTFKFIIYGIITFILIYKTIRTNIKKRKTTLKVDSDEEENFS
ncbi:hypothetical protein [Gorillibacterium sp. sgz5001074]|uniref:hypothetical protein n=1 Tax=Gorillibacterium sp. sgz5001074 TaxID=3446695 RepID=UPI003F66164B